MSRAAAGPPAQAGPVIPAAARFIARKATGQWAYPVPHYLDALLIGGVDLDDLPDPAAAQAGLEVAPFVVSLPAHSDGSQVRRDLGAGHGSLVTLRRPG